MSTNFKKKNIKLKNISFIPGSPNNLLTHYSSSKTQYLSTQESKPSLNNHISNINHKQKLSLTNNAVNGIKPKWSNSNCNLNSVREKLSKRTPSIGFSHRNDFVSSSSYFNDYIKLIRHTSNEPDRFNTQYKAFKVPSLLSDLNCKIVTPGKLSNSSINHSKNKNVKTCSSTSSIGKTTEKKAHQPIRNIKVSYKPKETKEDVWFGRFYEPSKKNTVMTTEGVQRKVEVDTPEELHFWYVSMIQNGKEVENQF